MIAFETAAPAPVEALTISQLTPSQRLRASTP